MLEVFIYPVSGVMKLWHMLTHAFVDDSLAWIISIILLVITVRGIVAPLNWLSVKSARIGALVRPEDTRLGQKMRDAESSEELAQLLREREALHKRYGHKPLVGCLPLFIMIPVFIGLYRMLLRMARSAEAHAVGLLSAEEVADFRNTHFRGAPITDFARHHTDIVTPLLITALVFTFATSLLSLYRSYLTMQFDRKVNRRGFWFSVSLLLLVPWLLWHIAFNGPIPVAIIIYWGCVYIFTFCQTLVFEAILRKRFPLPEEVHQLRRDSFARWRSKEKAVTMTKEQRSNYTALLKEARKTITAEKKRARAEKKAAKGASGKHRRAD